MNAGRKIMIWMVLILLTGKWITINLLGISYLLFDVMGEIGKM